ncbi:MAG: RNA pseudouridine synthase, partial [Sodaliphilus sp.]|nr:RNA pseudouridine synthase [Sodaliphilus sp.]
RLALHATRLCFEHPITGKKMEFESPIPANFLTLLR